MLKYEIFNRLPTLDDPIALGAAQRRLDYLWAQGYFEPGSSFAARLSSLHRRAGARPRPVPPGEVW